MSGKVAKAKKSKSKLIQTSSKSSPSERVKSSLAKTEPAGSSFELKDWLFVIALIAAVFLVYQPAWQGGFIWDDDFFATRPELRSWYGLFRIWFDLGATLGYYPLLHSAFWVQHWLWGDATLGYHLRKSDFYFLFPVILKSSILMNMQSFP